LLRSIEIDPAGGFAAEPLSPRSLPGQLPAIFRQESRVVARWNQSQREARIQNMELESLQDLYAHELKDLYSAESQLIKALPKMAKAATNRQLAAGFRQHLEQTKRHAKRLEQILKSHGESTRGPKCEGMEGLIAEGDKMAKEDAADEVRDAGLIAAAQRVEHYEIAGYGCARTYGRILGDKKGAKLLDTTLREEAETDKKLTKLATTLINLRAKKAPQQSAKREVGVAATIKKMVKKMTPSL
jgi:ferritin-like metal-binding protein YciE